MANAIKLLEKKSVKLRERLEGAQTELKKIDDCGEDMDGNTSHNEEEEFIDALKDEMPEVFKNIDANFDQLDKIDDLIVEVKNTNNIDKMQELKKEIDDASTKVDQCEGLVDKLEKEIIEWEAFKKLCRRDEELGEIDNLLGDFDTDLTGERNMMNKHMDKQEQNLEKNPDNQDVAQIIDEINDFMDDVDKLQKNIEQLKGDKDICFGEFDEDVPTPVKEARNKRLTSVMSPRGGKRRTPMLPGSTESDRPQDRYYMLKVNCKYRQRIHDMLKNLRNLNGKRRDLEEKYIPLKMKLNATPKAPVNTEFKAFKPVKGDQIDEMLCAALNRAQLMLPVKRLGPGQYMFGTRKIMCKIINNKLVIRVGGGYMSADEFIEQYGKIEMMKMQKAMDKADGGSPTRKGQMPNPNAAMGMGDMKAMMAGMLSNAKTYEEGPVNDFGGIGSKTQRQTVSIKGKDLASLQSEHNFASGFEKGGKSSRSPDSKRRQTMVLNPGLSNRLAAPQTTRATDKGRGGSPRGNH